MTRRPGKLVKCKDGAVGRTYNDEEPVNGKIKVYVFAASQADLRKPKALVKDCITKRLCDPDTLKVIGYAD